MIDLTHQLIALANDIGGNPEFSRAGGGNASIKEDGLLRIKPSGVPLATLTADDLVPLRLNVLLDALHSDEPVEGDPVRAAARAAQIGDANGRRPSVEILFHALIPDPLVLHLHPLTANALTCNVDGRRLTERIVGDDAVWVDYIDPGIPLARGVETARNTYVERTGRPAPGITLLGNHGIIVSGNSYDDVSTLVKDLTNRVRAAIEAGTPARVAIFQDVSDPEALTGAFRKAVGASTTASAWEGIARKGSGTEAGPVTGGPLIPDQIVYAGSLPVVLPAAADPAAVEAAVASFHEQHSRLPIVGVVPGAGVVATGDSEDAAANALATYLDALRVSRDANRLGAVRVMTPRERHFIENWEAEAYRRQVAKGK